jgi:hypothetical protein
LTWIFNASVSSPSYDGTVCDDYFGRELALSMLSDCPTAGLELAGVFDGLPIVASGVCDIVAAEAGVEMASIGVAAAASNLVR